MNNRTNDRRTPEPYGSKKACAGEHDGKKSFFNRGDTPEAGLPVLKDGARSRVSLDSRLLVQQPRYFSYHLCGGYNNNYYWSSTAYYNRNFNNCNENSNNSNNNYVKCVK